MDIPTKRAAEEDLDGDRKRSDQRNHYIVEEEEDDDSYEPPLGPTEELELFPGMKVELPAERSAEVQNVGVQNVGVQTVEVTSKSDLRSLDAEEEVNLQSKNVSIQGTNIVLDSPEDIAKWIEERKKNWPTAKRVAEKAKQREADREVLKANGAPAGRSNQRVCKFFQRTGHCKNGDKCKFLHERRKPQDKSHQHGKQGRCPPNHQMNVVHGIPVAIPQRFTPMMNKGKSLNSLLVESEHIKDENVKLIDVFERLVRSGIVKPDWDTLKEKLSQ